MHILIKSTASNLKYVKHLFFTMITLLMFYLAGSNATAQDKIPFGDNDTLEEIRAKIEHNGYKFTVDHNWVFDLTPEEKAKMFPRHRTPMPGSSIPVPYSDVLLKRSTESALPSKLDWRNVDGHSYIGPVRNQGNSCACVTFGCTDAASLSYNVTNGLYDQNCAVFSVMYFLWTLGPKYNGFGYSGGDAEYNQFYALMKSGGTQGAVGFEGAISEADFPFVDSDQSPPPDVIEKSKTYPRVTFKNWNRCMPDNYLDTTEKIKEAIAAHGSVAVQVRHHTSAFHAYRSGIYEDTYTMPDSVPYYRSSTGHGLSLVGWDDNPPEGGGGCWILRNEWGTDWGDKGYMRIRDFSALVNTAAAYVDAGESPGQYAIRGTVKGPVYVAVTLSLSGSGTSSITSSNDSGNPFALGDLAAGTYTVTPSYPGCSFEPASRKVTLPTNSEDGDFTGCDFTSKLIGPFLTMAASPETKGVVYPLKGVNPIGKDQWTYISARTADPCYAFKEWNISGSAELKHDKSSAVNEIRLSGDANATAVFEDKGPPEEVVLSMAFYMGFVNGTLTPGQGKHNVPYNIPVKIEVIPFDDFVFASWDVEGQVVVEDIRNPSTTVTLQGDADVRPNIKPKNHEATMCVSPDNSGTTNPAPGPHAFPYDVGVNIQAVPVAGYYFEKWTGQGGAGVETYYEFKDVRNPNTTVKIKDKAKVIANFKEIANTGKLTMETSGEGSGTTNPAVGEHEIPVGAWTPIEAIPAEDSFFESWTIEGSATIDKPYDIQTLIRFFDNDDARATLTANFAKIVNTVTLTMALGGPDFSESSTNPGVGDHIVPVGEWTDIQAFPADGWFFDKWIVEGDAEIIDMFNQDTAVSLKNNATVTAYFKPAYTTAILTMAVSPENSGETNPPAGQSTVNVGEHIEIQAIPATGYFFEKWTSTGTAEITDEYDDNSSVVLAADATVTANFAQIVNTATLTLAVTPDASGSTNPGVGAHIVPVGAHVQIQAIPASGYFFEKWTSSADASIADIYSDDTDAVLSADATVTANFATVVNTAALTMAVSPSSYSGSVYPGMGKHTFAIGEPVSVLAVASSGFLFSCWAADSSVRIEDAYSPETTVWLSADGTVTAVFISETSPATLTMAVSPDGTGTTSPSTGGHVVFTLSPLQIDAEASAGKVFVCWQASANVTIVEPFNSSSSAILFGDATVTAIFADSPIDFVSLGSILKYVASEVDPEEQEFTAKPSIWGEYTDPVKALVGKKAPICVLTKVPRKAPFPSSVSAEWKKKISLYDSSKYWNRKFQTSQKIIGLPIDALYMDKIMIKSKQFGKDALEIKNRKSALSCPSISGISGNYSIKGDKFMVTGMFFGEKAPEIYVECRKSDKTYTYLRCKIVKDETYVFQNAKGKANSSCMKIHDVDISGGFAASPTGWSSVTALYPDIRNTTPTGYLILDNSIGLSTMAFP